MKQHFFEWHTVVLLLFAVFFAHHARAQKTYQLRSFEGITVSVRVYEQETPRALVIACATDTVLVYDYWAPEREQVLNQQFLQLTYAVRGGSNLGFGSTLVLNLSQGKLHQVLKAETFRKSDFSGPKYEHERYQVQLCLLGQTPQTYQFRLTIHDESQSALSPDKNHKFTNQVILKLDTKRNLFYTGFKRVPSRFRVLDDKAGVVTRKVMEPLPVIALNGNVQYFIQGEWYKAASIKE